MASLLLLGWRSGLFTSAANAADIDLSDDENSNDGGDSSDDDAEKNIDKRNNYEEELDPSRIENLLLDDRDYELTEHHAGADETLVQLIKTKQEASKYLWMSKGKA